jgi:hypothetical protein
MSSVAIRPAGANRRPDADPPVGQPIQVTSGPVDRGRLTGERASATLQRSQEVMDDVRQFIGSVNPGRRPTRIGNDGLAPSLQLPRRYTPSLLRHLGAAGFTTCVSEWGVVDDDRYGVFVMLDCIECPGANAQRMQQVVDDWRVQLPWPGSETER